jgi:tripeptidyl-peptidase-1
VKCTASVQKINSLLSVNIESYINIITKQVKYRSDIAYIIPDDLKQYIIFIDGICNPLYEPNELKIMFPNEKYSNNNDVDPGGFTREVMSRLYNMTKTFDDQYSSVGAMEYNSHEGFSNRDLYDAQVGNGVVPNMITGEHIIGISSNFPDGESELDVQVMYYGAPNATLWYEAYGGWMYGWANDFFNRDNVPEVVSLSWGWSETDQCYVTSCQNGTSQQYVERCNAEFLKIVARGITIVVASGDAGSAGKTNQLCQSEFGTYGWNNINAEFPAGSPWILSVGATYIVKSNKTFDYTTPICTNFTKEHIICANGVTEQGIYWNKTGWTTGGGFTHWNPMPLWQASVVESYLNSGINLPNAKYFNSQTRAYPDVSAVGHNCIIHLMMGSRGVWGHADGTSCSAPVFAGIIAQLNAYQKQRGYFPLGYVNPLMYLMYDYDPSTFNDITMGTTQCTETQCCDNDFGFRATTGWDPVSGLGTPNVDRMIAYLSKF